MKRFGSLEILIFITVIVGGLIYIFRPVHISRDNCIVFKAMVYQVTEGREKNVILKLARGRGTFYINHGLQKGLSLDTLRNEIVNRQVTGWYLKPGFLAGFSSVASTKYITELKLGNKIIYTEL